MNTQESLEIASSYSKTLGALPTVFAVTMRRLLSDAASGNKQMTRETEIEIDRLLRSNTLMACVYFAAKTFHEESLTATPTLSRANLARLFDPFTCASLFTMIYLYRRSKKVVPEDEWHYIAEPLQRNLEIGAFIGYEFPEIGAGHGMIGGSMLYFAFSTFLSHDKKGFAEYRRHLKKVGKTVDPNYESKRWGCTSLQVASHMLVDYGYSSEVAFSFSRSLGETTKTGGKHDGRDTEKFSFVRKWIETFYAGLSNPSLFKTLEESGKISENLKRRCIEVFQKGSRYRWLERVKEDFTPENCPQLFSLGVVEPVSEIAEATVIDSQL